MKSEQILEALDAVDDRWLQDAKPDAAGFALKRNRLRALAIAAAAAVILLLSGFTVYKVGLVNGWWQRPSNDPLAVVQSAVEGEINWEYTQSASFERAEIDEAETARWKSNLKGSELARSYGWSDDYIEHHFLVVRAVYTVQYDHTKTWEKDGRLEQLYFLRQDQETNLWEVYEAMSPNEAPEPSE